MGTNTELIQSERSLTSVTMKIFIAMLALASALPSIDQKQSSSFLSRSRRENADAICGDDCTDECLIECEENFLEQVYKYPRYRQQQLREYFNNKSAFD